VIHADETLLQKLPRVSRILVGVSLRRRNGDPHLRMTRVKKKERAQSIIKRHKAIIRTMPSVRTWTPTPQVPSGDPLPSASTQSVSMPEVHVRFCRVVCFKGFQAGLLRKELGGGRLGGGGIEAMFAPETEHNPTYYENDARWEEDKSQGPNDDKAKEKV